MTQLSKFLTSSFLLVAIALNLFALPLLAQESFPVRPITLIVPLSAGSQMDVLGRALAEGLGKYGTQPVMVQNKDGAAMVIGMDAVSKAKPDGYTIGFGTESPLTLAPHLISNLPYKTSDFELICRTNVANMVVVVGPQSPFKTFEDLVTAARKSPGTLTYATAGVGTPPHLLMEAVAIELGLKFSHVPFRVISDMAVQTMNGSVDFAVTVPNTLAVNGSRGMRGLTMTGSSSMEELPSVPLIKDILGASSSIANYGVGGLGIFAPKGLRPETLGWLRSACKSAAASTNFLAVSTRTFTPVGYADSSEFMRTMQENSRISGEVVRKLNIKVQ